MSKSSKTQSILKDKATKLNPDTSECLPCKAAQEQTKPKSETECLPCQAKSQTLWKIYVQHSDFFSDTTTSNNNYVVLGDALQQFANFSAAQVQSVFTSMALLPNDLHLVYSGNGQSATAIHNALAQAGLRPRIEASLKTF
jgi:hypothetical protein